MRFSINDLPLPRSRWVAIAVGAIVIALIGRLDFDAGYEASVAVLYLLPIALVAWVAGPGWGMTAAVGCAGIGLLADLMTIAQFHNRFVPFWNAAVQFSVFALFALALAALRASFEREHEVSRLDYVTRASNWRAFAEAAESEISRMRRWGRSATLVYIDCDRFKAVNDTRGHAEGDRLLRIIADVLHETVRTVDTVARLGGDEFVVLMPETGPEAAERAVTRIRTRLDESLAQEEWGVTISAGVATFVEAPDSLDEMVKAADRLLYEAKENGRDRVMRETFGTCA